MRKLKALKSEAGIWLVVFAGIVSLLIAGCGSNLKTEVSVVPGQAKGLVVCGTVYDSNASNDYYYYGGNTIINDPISDANVTMAALGTTINTDAKGYYSFKEVSPGAYTVMVTKEGFQTAIKNGSFVSNPSDNTILTLDVNLDSRPIVLSAGIDKSVTPEAVVVVFNEAMDISTIIPTLSYEGIRTLSGGLEIEKSWDAANKVLTIRPQSGFISGAKYKLKIVGPLGSYSSVKDIDGNSMSNSQYTEVDLTTTSTVAAPSSAPANLKVTSNSGSTEVDYWDINYFNYYYSYYDDSDFITLSWDKAADAAFYNVYARVKNGPFQKVSSSIYDNINISINDVDSALADLTRTGDYCPRDYGNGIVWPFIGENSIDFKIVAATLSGEGGSSNIINVKDTIMPKVKSCSKNSSTVITVYFSEPLGKSSAQNTSNYSISGQTIKGAILSNNYYSSDYNYVALELSPGTTEGTVVVSSDVKDLSSNGINPNANSANF